MKKIAIIGTRRRDTSVAKKLIEAQFWQIYEDGSWIISGGCQKGGDRFAEVIAKANGIPILTIYPNYKKFKQGATFIRNGDVAKNADYVIACVMDQEDGLEAVLARKKGGTEDTLRKFAKLGWDPFERIILV